MAAPPKALDEEEAIFLDQVAEKRKEKERRIKSEEDAELATFGKGQRRVECRAGRNP